MAAADASHRSASQVMREMMRDFVRRHQDGQDHLAFLHRKVEAARASVADGHGRPDDAVEADFAARRARIIDAA